MLEPRLIRATECKHWQKSIVFDEIIEGKKERVPREIIPELCDECELARLKDPVIQAQVAEYFESGKMQEVLTLVKDARVSEITDRLCHGD